MQIIAFAIIILCGTIVYLINSNPPSSDFSNTSTNTTSVISNSQESPERFMYYYFENLINSGNYDEAWSHLSTAFQNEAGGYQSYVNFWSGHTVTVNSVSLNDQSANYAQVTVSLKFRKNGNTKNQTIKYKLTYDNNNDKWLFIPKD